MGEVVNLRTAKKQAARKAARAQADANAARHGQSKTDRLRQKAEAEKATRHLDAHRRTPGDGEAP